MNNQPRRYTDSERWRLKQINDAFQNDPNRHHLFYIKSKLVSMLSPSWTIPINADGMASYMNAEVSYPDELGNNAELNRQIAHIDKELDLIKAKYDKQIQEV